MAPIDKDVYIKQFSALKRGTPLYLPCEVQVGDVGFIDVREGFFQKLYNIADPPANGKPGCPPPIELNKSLYTEEWGGIHLKKSKSGVTSSPVTIPGRQVQYVFPEVKHGECILIPGSIVVMERLEGTSNLPKYMHDHLKWIGSTFIGDDGFEFTPQSLMLIVRTVKTDRWAIAVNTSSDVVKNLSFNTASAVSPTVWGEWSTNSLVSRRGPASATGGFLPTGIEGATQTIFVHHIALGPPISYFGRPSFRFFRKHSALERFRATIASIKQDGWVVKEREDTQSLPAAAPGASGLRGVIQTDSNDNLNEE